MATKKTIINGWDAGWPTGFLSNIDEEVTIADGQVITTTIADDTVLLDFAPVSGTILDGDLVTGIRVRIRSSYTETDVPTSSTGYLAVSFLIDSVNKGTENTANLSEGLANQDLTNAGWDDDWTPAQLDGLQLLIQAKTPDGSLPSWSLDCIDLTITFTRWQPVPASAALALTGKVPVVDISTDSPVRRPAAATPTLAGQAPTLGFGLAVPKLAVRVRPTPSYLNPLEVRLNPTGYDGGWPTGLLSNIDEPVATPDGQTISSTIDFDEVKIAFVGAFAALKATDTVIGLEYLVRIKQPGTTSPPAGANSTLFIEGQGVAGITRSMPSAFEDVVFEWNEAISQNGYDDGQPVPWTREQLDTLQLRFLHVDQSFPGTETFIDAIDVIVTYSPQSPVLIRPAAGSLTTATAAPELQEKFLRALTEITPDPVLAGKVPTLFREDASQPSLIARLLTGKAPKRVVNHRALPSIDALLLVEQAVTRVVAHYVSPAIDDLVLAGKEPVPEITDNYIALPAVRRLRLFGEAPLTQGIADTTVGPVKGPVVIEGRVPVMDQSFNVWSATLVQGVTLTGKTPQSVLSQVRAPAKLALSLTPQAAGASIGRSALPTEATISFTSFLPMTGGAAATLVIAPQQPVVGIGIGVPAAAVSLTGRFIVSVANSEARPRAGSLSFAAGTTPTPPSPPGYPPTIDVTGTLTPGQPGLISITIDYDIEFIATPTDILIQ